MAAVKKCKFRNCSEKGRPNAMPVHFKILSSFSVVALARNSKQEMMCFNCLAKKTSIVALLVHQNCVFLIALCAEISDPQETFVAMPDKSGSRRCDAEDCAVIARFAAKAFKTSASLYATQSKV